MKICIAQIRSIKGDILANIQKHKMMISLAATLEASAIFFSELSLTGYEPELAKDTATSQDDHRLEVFQKMSDTKKITIGLGLPTKTDLGVQISMIIFQPERTKITYSKQQLHSDELPYFVIGEKQIILTVDNIKIAPAICFESLQNDHSAYANKLCAEIYVASVAKSQRGIDKAMIHYPAIAKKYSMPVLMSNCVGYCDNFKSVGKSAVWNNQGELVEQLDDQTEGLLVFNTETEKVIKQII